MGRLLHGRFVLEIIELRPPLNHQLDNPDEHTARYEARVIETVEKDINLGDIVSVKMLHHGNHHAYFGRIGIFDGDANDIQDNPAAAINMGRSGRDPMTFINPFEP
jgi:hypothetical protein